MYKPIWLLNFLTWFGKNKLKGIASIVLITLSIAIGLGVMLIDSILKPILSAKLKSAILAASDSLYKIDFSDAELHILSGKAILYNAKLSADTAVYARMRHSGNAPGEVYNISVKQLSVDGAHPLKMYFHKQLDIGLIHLSSPQILLTKYFSKVDTVKRKNTTLYQKLSKTFRSIKVGSIKLGDISIKENNYLRPKLAISSLKELNISATGLLIDSATQTDTSRTLFCQDIVVNLNRFKLNTADGLYQFKIQKVSFSTKNKKLSFFEGEMTPLPATSFFQKTDKLDRYSLKLDAVIIKEFDFNTYYTHQSFSAKGIIIRNGYFEVYTNPRGKPKPGDRFVTFPNYVVTHLKTPITIDTATFKNIKVVYTEYNASSHHIGSVYFNNTTGEFLNITNNKLLIVKNNTTKLYLTTYLMGAGKLGLHAKFSLNNPLYSYNYRGHLGAINLLDGNVALEPLGLIKINSGEVKSLDFDITGNKNSSSGKITFLYNNLKVAVLKGDSTKSYFKRPLVSLFANTFVIKDNNPDDNTTAPRAITVRYIRPLKTPFFGNIWFTLLSGIKSTVGLGNKQSVQTTAPSTSKEHKMPFIKKLGKSISKIFR